MDKWKSLGNDQYQDSEGNVFYSSPEQDIMTPLFLMWSVGTMLPILMVIPFILGVR